VAHFILPAVMLLSVTCVSGAVTIGGVNFTLDKVAKAALASPVNANIKPSYVAVLPPTKAASLDISRLTPVVNRAADQPAAAMEARSVFTHSVAVESLRVRSGPHKTSSQLFALKGGTMVNLLREEHGWVLIDAGTGQQGWVYGKLLRPVDATAARLH